MKRICLCVLIVLVRMCSAVGSTGSPEPLLQHVALDPEVALERQMHHKMMDEPKTPVSPVKVKTTVRIDYDLISETSSPGLTQPSSRSSSAVVYSDDFENEVNIRTALEHMPIKYRPQNIEKVLIEMDAGDKILKFVQDGNFYGAVLRNVDILDEHDLFSAADTKNLQTAFGSTDERFWNVIQNNPTMKALAAKWKIPFDLKTFMLPEYNMLFRVSYVRSVAIDPKAMTCFIKAYQTSLIQLQWALFRRSILYDQAFTSGMVTFNDPGFLVFKLMDGYSELISPEYKFYTGKSLRSIQTTGAYTRESSHWTGQKIFDGKNFGIDIKNDQGKIASVLPGNKSHILFGVRDNDMTFVKWEEYGVTFNVKEKDFSVWTHTKRYFEKRHVEDTEAQRREKIPKAVQQEFAKLYTKPLNSQQKELIETYGISKMLSLLQQESPLLAQQFETFLTGTMHYQPDTLRVRKGSEIIIHLPTTGSIAAASSVEL